MGDKKVKECPICNLPRAENEGDNLKEPTGEIQIPICLRCANEIDKAAPLAMPHKIKRLLELWEGYGKERLFRGEVIANEIRSVYKDTEKEPSGDEDD